ncbi:MAG: adenylate kinase [Candidatus Atribacteria bacterium]|jgi:adenylate kinase|nr:MAG: adenylate kinase [Candidatus Atribacteria bacterium]
MALRHVVLLGPPGAGKGTQAKQIINELGLVHLSTGDILRDEVSRETELGKTAKGFMDRGDLVPDQLIIDMIRGRIEAADQGFLLDGFPRTTAQAEALAAFATIDVVLNIGLAREEVVRRLAGRRVCRDCGAIYNLTFNLAEGETTCAKCGGELYQRDDDKTEVIANRYDIYERSTAPLIEYYTRQGVVRTLDGAAGSENVFSEILELLSA